MTKDGTAWRDISTALKDGTPILLGHKHSAFVGWWDAQIGAWVDGCTSGYDDDLVTYEPTHWMPLPTPPVEGEDGTAEPDALTVAVTEWANVRADFEDFDGDRRGIAQALAECEFALAAMVGVELEDPHVY